MMHKVCANVVMDLVEDPIIMVKSGHGATEVAPLLHHRAATVLSTFAISM